MVKELIAGKSLCCLSCSVRRRMAALSSEQRKALATKASLAAARKSAAERERTAVYRAQLSTIKTTMRGALQRCTDTQNISYKNYGARGIEFRFSGVTHAAVWVFNNLGPRPAGRSIDRIDNNGNYEPGNLRWATRKEQNGNKRGYHGSVYGRRVQDLLSARADYTYEGIRTLIQLGYTDEEILNRRKGAHAKTSV